MMQGSNLPDPDECSKIRSDIKAAKKSDRKSAIMESKLPELTLRSVKQAKEKGASGWLSVLPLKDQGFSLHKGEFRDAHCNKVRQDNQRFAIELPMWSSV